jgi:hypothetical protein
MNVGTLLKLQLEDAHRTLEGTLSDIDEVDAHKEPGGRAFKVAANYGHVVFAEDQVINRMLRQQQPLYTTTWDGRTGFSEPMPSPLDLEPGAWPEIHDKWARALRVDLAQARRYAEAVQSDALGYLAAQSEADLEREMDLKVLPPMPQALVLTVFVIGHYYSLAGEMSAAKGVAGLKGYPF